MTGDVSGEVSYAWGWPGNSMGLEEVRLKAVEDVQAGRGGIAVIAAKWGIYGKDLTRWVADAAPTEPPPGGHDGGHAT